MKSRLKSRLKSLDLFSKIQQNPNSPDENEKKSDLMIHIPSAMQHMVSRKTEPRAVKLYTFSRNETQK